MNSWGGNESARISAIHEKLTADINELKYTYDELENLIDVDMVQFVAAQRRANDG